MSKETIQWLNENTLIGFTEKRSRAWHYRAGSNNHYPGAVPIEDVKRRLFDWTAEEHPLYAEVALDEFVHIPGRKAIIRSDNRKTLGIFKDSYVPHQYQQWLLDNVATILDDNLQVGSAGLLRGGAIAWVSVEVPETIITPEGVPFRPFLMATTSFDGSIATTYKRGVTNVVCDNTMAAFLRQAGEVVKVRHSSKSLDRITDVREALGIVYGIADDFSAQVAELAKVSVSAKDFEVILEHSIPLPKKNPKQAENRRDKIRAMYATDERVTPWAGTGFGVWQAFNTYMQHEGQVRGMSRPERNMLRTVNGEIEAADAETVRRILELTA